MVFSIIIPVFNTSSSLHRCLNSIQGQTFQDWECILVDDGSTDASGSICDEYAINDKRFKVIHKENQGASAARNAGLDVVSGEWISFVDSDDWVSSDYLQTFNELKNKSDITFFAASQDFPNGNSIIRLPKYVTCNDRIDIEKVFFELKHGNIGDILGWTWNKFYRADFLNKNNVRFDESIIFREDEIFIMEAGCYATSVTVLNYVLYHYCYRNCGLTANGIQIEDYKLLSDRLAEILPHYKNDNLLKSDYQRVAEYKIKYALLKGRLWTSVKYVGWLYSFFKNTPNVSLAGRYRLLAPQKRLSFLLALIFFFPMRLWEIHRR